MGLRERILLIFIISITVFTGLIFRFGAGRDREERAAAARDMARPHELPLRDDTLILGAPFGGDPAPFPLSDDGFLGITNTGVYPPDPHLAAGPARLVVIVNGGIAYFEKDGTKIFQQKIEGINGFWGSVGATNTVFDPEVLYDTHAGRFMAMACEWGPGNTYYLLFAVSDNADPEGAWYKYRIDATPQVGDFIDSPNMSADSEAVYLAADGWSDGAVYAIYMLEKAPLLDGSPPTIMNTMIINGFLSHGLPLMYGSAPAMYLIEHVRGGDHASVRLHAITDPLGTPSRETYTLEIPPYTAPEDPPQLGTSTPIETFDARFWSCVWRHGSLWACHHTGKQRVLARWYEIGTNGWPSGGKPELRQWGEVDPGAGVRTFFNSISVDEYGNAAMCFSRSSPTEYISICRAVRLVTDPPGTMRPPVTLKASTAPYALSRWGDYSAVSVDPANGRTFWMHHEYTPGGSSWNTWISYFQAGWEDMPPFIVTGPGPGEANPPEVRVFSASDPDVPVYDFMAYGVSRLGVHVSAGELDGDEPPELVTGPGPGPIFGPRVRGWELTGGPMPGLKFLAYGTRKFGVNVALGDMDGDGLDEIVTGAGPGAVFGPHVRAFKYDGTSITPVAGVSFMAYGTSKFGVNVACGDPDGDHRDEIVTGAGPGAVFGPHVRGFNYDGVSLTSLPGLSFFAYRVSKWGVHAACGDLNGEDHDEIITGPGPGVFFSPHVRGWLYAGGEVTAMAGVSFFAYGQQGYGVRVGSGNLDDDAYSEILSAPGPGESLNCRIRGWDVDGGTAAMIPSIDFPAYAGTVTHGGNVTTLRN